MCFSVIFCETCKDTFFYRAPPVAASGISYILHSSKCLSLTYLLSFNSSFIKGKKYLGKKIILLIPCYWMQKRSFTRAARKKVIFVLSCLSLKPLFKKQGFSKKFPFCLRSKECERMGNKDSAFANKTFYCLSIVQILSRNRLIYTLYLP